MTRFSLNGTIVLLGSLTLLGITGVDQADARGTGHSGSRSAPPQYRTVRQPTHPGQVRSYSAKSQSNRGVSEVLFGPFNRKNQPNSGGSRSRPNRSVQAVSNRSVRSPSASTSYRQRVARDGGSDDANGNNSNSSGGGGDGGGGGDNGTNYENGVEGIPGSYYDNVWPIWNENGGGYIHPETGHPYLYDNNTGDWYYLDMDYMDQQLEDEYNQENDSKENLNPSNDGTDEVEINSGGTDEVEINSGGTDEVSASKGGHWSRTIRTPVKQPIQPNVPRSGSYRSGRPATYHRPTTLQAPSSREPNLRYYGPANRSTTSSRPSGASASRVTPSSNGGSRFRSR